MNKFILRKVKLQPNGGLKCEYQTDDRNQSMENLERSSTDVVHPDLKAAFNKMKIAIIKSFKLDWAMTYLTENLLSSDAHKAAMKVITPILEEGQLAIDNLVTVTGFSISGEGPTEGVVITGTIECKGKKQGVSSQRIVFNQQSWGFESEIEDDVLAATQEVKEYLFENKVGQAQADLFNNSDPDADNDWEEEEDDHREDPHHATITPAKQKMAAPKKKAAPKMKAAAKKK